MGAMTKLRVWRPRLRLSPSLTTSAEAMAASLPGKYIRSMGTVLALHTSRAPGQRSSTASTMAAWSGSMWSITR